MKRPNNKFKEIDAINMARYVKGLKSSIEVLKTMRKVQT
jgi:hypothetical protein